MLIVDGKNGGNIMSSHSAFLDGLDAAERTDLVRYSPITKIADEGRIGL
jgi:hypothetical protein